MRRSGSNKLNHKRLERRCLYSTLSTPNAGLKREVAGQTGMTSCINGFQTLLLLQSIVILVYILVNLKGGH